jgi:DNA-binding NarL/FixJ family response regulator
MRVVIADDELLLREGLARLLQDAGIEVTGTAGTPDELLRQVRLRQPDVVIVDIRMPPSHTEEGLVAAAALQRTHPDVGVLVLSHYLAPSYAARLLDEHPGGAGYLLKERISDLAVLTDALARVADGECVIDPTIVARLLARARAPNPLDGLTPREREVLALIAEGRSNQAICRCLVLSPKTVEAHIHHVFAKLGIGDDPDAHRRVAAVLAYLRAS